MAPCLPTALGLVSLQLRLDPVATVTVTTTASNAPSTSSNSLCAVHSNTLPSGVIASLAVLGCGIVFHWMGVVGESRETATETHSEQWCF